MIYLITGTPGAGKTSHTLWDFLNDKTLKDRPRYATPINGLDYDAHGIERIDNIEGWQDLPDGSVILIDEADQFMPAQGRAVPDYIRMLARHRHRGFDFYIITQMGSMINHFVRGLIEAHIHYIRVRGDKTVSRYRWESYQSSPDNPSVKAKGIRDRLKVNPEVFDLYTSATINTRKREIPWKQIAIICAAVPALIGSILFTRYILLPKTSEPAKAAVVAPVPLQAAFTVPSNSLTPDRKDAYSMADFVPRSPIDPSTAPVYDELTKPSDFPRIAACMDSKIYGCNCYTQQATPLTVPEHICRDMIKRGWFDRWASQRAQAARVLARNSEDSTVSDSRPGQHALLDQSQP